MHESFFNFVHNNIYVILLGVFFVSFFEFLSKRKPHTNVTTFRDYLEQCILHIVFARTVITILLLSILFSTTTPFDVFFAGGLILFVTAYFILLKVTELCISCPFCKANLASHLERGYKGRTLRIPKSMCYCPSCETLLDEAVPSEKMDDKYMLFRSIRRLFLYLLGKEN